MQVIHNNIVLKIIIIKIQIIILIKLANKNLQLFLILGLKFHVKLHRQIHLMEQILLIHTNILKYIILLYMQLLYIQLLYIMDINMYTRIQTIMVITITKTMINIIKILQHLCKDTLHIPIDIWYTINKNKLGLPILWIVHSDF